MMPVTVVARVVARPEAVAALRSELMKLLVPTRAEPGCLEYRLHQDMTDPTLFLFYENWVNMECLQEHMESAHFVAYLEASAGLIADKTVHLMTEQQQGIDLCG